MWNSPYREADMAAAYDRLAVPVQFEAAPGPAAVVAGGQSIDDSSLREFFGDISLRAETERRQREAVDAFTAVAGPAIL